MNKNHFKYRLALAVLLANLFVFDATAFAGCPGSHGAGSSPALSDDALSASITAAGFPAEAVPTMLCIAREESGKYPEAYCMNSDDTEVLAWGVFQIYKIWFSQCAGTTDPDAQLSILSDAGANAKCAYRAYLTAKSQTGVGYNAWDVYSKLNKCKGL